MLDRTLAEQLKDLASGKYSSLELTEAYLEKIQRNEDLNCYISISESSREAAKAADSDRQAGGSAPLLGVPIAHKDIFCLKGGRTTAGSQMLDNFVSPYDATVVEKLNESGAITLGKTNMDEFAMGSSNENSYYGVVKNPWDPTKVPGGSSGGSASAVAAQLCSAATGTDTGGSIRQPAAFCNVTGLKPTYGRVSRWGMIAYASSLDQAGPMARTAEDCAHLLNAMAGHDVKDSTCAQHPTEDYVASLGKPIESLRVGVCEAFFRDLDNGVASVLQDSLAELEKLGATLVDIDLPNSSTAIPAYYIIAPAECSANLSRFDGVRYGYRCENPIDINDLYKRSRSEAFGQEVKNRIMVGAFALSAGYYDAYYRKAQQIRRLIKNDFATAFEGVDLICSPTTPGTAFGIGEKSDDAQAMYLQDIFTITANLAGLPAMSIPAGFVSGLPIGMQLIGSYFQEAKLLNVAHQYQMATDWHQQVPQNV